ncbi:MAG: CHAT domain-containing protein [Fimbriimonadaceae bacterium]
MSIDDVLSILESPARLNQAKRAVAAVDMHTLAPAYFARVAELSGQDSGACVRLARRYHLISDLGFAFRAKAVGERARGRWSEAADSFLTAAEYRSNLDRYIFSLGAIDSLARAGKPDQAIQFGLEAIHAFDRAGEPQLSARAHINVGNAYSWQDSNVEAGKHYQAAIASLPQDATAERAMAHLGLSTAELYLGDAKVALKEAESAHQLFEEAGSTYHASLARLNTAQAKTMLGRADEAVVEFLSLREELWESLPDRLRIQEFLGDAYYQLNLLDESKSAYLSGLSSRTALRMPLNVANCHYGLARALGDADPDLAARHFRFAARVYRQVGNRVWEMSALARAALYGRNANRIEQVYQAIEGLREQNALFLAEEAELLGIRRGWIPLGDPPLSVLLEWQYAWLRAKQNQDVDAYRETFELIERDRLLVRSPSASIHFLDDRGKAISEYLELLLSSPTDESVKEAMNVLSRTRSAALITEILSARSSSLTSEAILELDQLRDEISHESAPGSRLQATAAVPLASREWTEKTWRHLEPSRPQSSSPAAGEIWIDTGAHLYQISEGVSRQLKGSHQEIRSALNWVEFYLLEPMVTRNCAFDALESNLDGLRSTFKTRGGRISPDGLTWRIPWTLMGGAEPVLQLNPGSSHDLQAITFGRDALVAVWLGESDDIPALDQELEGIRKSFPHMKVLRSRGEIRETYAEHFDIIHVMGHARLNDNNPMFSYLQFPDGPLYATEVARSGLTTRLATVAACQTGTIRSNRAYEPEGIVRSFLACGAAAALGSLWPLDDQFSALFMATFYESLANGGSLTSSVQLARAKGKENMPHPYFWGSLALFSGYQPI